MKKQHQMGSVTAEPAFISTAILLLFICALVLSQTFLNISVTSAKETNSKVGIDPNAIVYWKELSDFLANDFAVDPEDPANIYIATDYPTAVAYSHDFGTTWTTKLDEAGDGHAIAIDPINPNYVYVGTTAGAIYRSDDHGDTWQRIDAGVSNGKYLSDLYVHPITPTLVFAGSSFGTPEIYRSDDRGETWLAISLVTEPTNKEVKQILSHPTIPNRIFAVVQHEGILVSEDAGLNWTNTGVSADAIAIDSSDPNIMYRLNCTPYRSNDGGTTWDLLQTPQPCYDKIYIDPQDSNVVYLTSQYRRVTRSLDAGQNWQILGGEFFSGPYSSSFAIDPVDTTRLYVGQGVYVSVYLDKYLYLPVVLR